MKTQMEKMMILNPFMDDVSTIPGTRILSNQRGIHGTSVVDPRNPDRFWTIQWLFAPLPTRLLGGVRAMLTDVKGFITFCNQRDLEVILKMARPGSYCKWAREDYPEPGQVAWYGLCCDEIDLEDDLFMRECEIRTHYTEAPYLPTGMELLRRVHFDENSDAEEMLTLLGDCDMDTGAWPDSPRQRLHS